MLDWLTLKTDICNLNDDAREQLRASQSRILSINPDGVVEWEKLGRETVRSDSHQITVEVGGDLMIYGSPARVDTKRVDNVFGSGDPVECAKRMIGFVERVKGVQLPNYKMFKCTRMDVTHNYDMGSIENVIAALQLLRHCEGGRYQVQTSAETVYWSVRSTRRSGKAYSKGMHMEYLAKRGRSFLQAGEQIAVNRLLRLELQLKRHFFARAISKPWYELNEDDLNKEHSDYFGQFIGDVEVSEMTDMQKACIEAALRLGLTIGMGKAAYLSWNTIRAVGSAEWKANTAKATMYRHLKIMKAAGLCYADFRARNVFPIRKRRVVLDKPVASWADLMKVA